MKQVYIIRSQQQIDLLIRFIQTNWQSMAQAGKPMAVHCLEDKRNATQEQRGLMWLRLQDIERQVFINGRQYSADVWHEYCKQKFLPEEDGPTHLALADYRKWSYMPDGQRILMGSTERLTAKGKSWYIQQIEAFGAEMGVQFSANPNEVYDGF